MRVESWPEWLRPQGGYKAQDLDELDLPPHTELIDGGLVFVSPQRRFHSNVVDLLTSGLRAAAPAQWWVDREMTIMIDDYQRPEPDVVVLARSALGDGSETWYAADQVLLAVEVVSPDSAVRDRERKPQLYARAGIRHFWRVEEVDLQPVVYTYELDPASTTYVPTGIHRGRLAVEVPFAVDLSLAVH